MKIKLTLVLIMASFLFGFSQEMSDTQHKGYIIDKDGNKHEGIIELNYNAPWDDQRKIKFIAMDKWESGDKIKNKDRHKMTTKDIIEYGYDGKVYKLVKYRNVSALGETANNSKMGRFNKISSGLKNAKSTYFAEVYQEGNMSMYKFYNAPPDVSVSSGEETAELQKLAEDCKTNYDVIIAKQGEGAKSFEAVNVKKYFKDCDYVSKKFKNKEYTRKPVKGLKSMAGNAMLLGDRLAASAKEMVDDYNANCGG